MGQETWLYSVETPRRMDEVLGNGFLGREENRKTEVKDRYV